MRVDGYIRVSQVRDRGGESFISPDVQRERIEAWAAHRGAQVAEWHVDLDQSGARDDRPGLLAAVERVEAGLTEGIVVAKLDRFARSLTGALEAIQRVHGAGGIVVSDAEGIDPSTPAGKMMMRLLLVIAEWELDRVRETWQVSRERAVRRGVHIASAAPTGYVRREDGRLEPHPQDGPVIGRLFELRAAGWSWSELARHLDGHRVQGPYGALSWRTRAVSHIIANRVYLGEARSGEFVNPAAHEPLVDRATWEAAQAARGVQPSRGEPALLAGLLRCAGCRHVLKPDRMTLRDGSRARLYRCRGQHATGECQGRVAVLGSVIEPWAEGQALARWAQLAAEPVSGAREAEEARALALRAEEELAAYRDDERIAGALGADRYVEGLRARAAAADDAHRALAEVQAAMGPQPAGTVALGDAWPGLEVRERQRVLKSMMDCIVLRGGRLAIERRAVVLWRGEAPDDLPRRGLRRVPLRPFDGVAWPD